MNERQTDSSLLQAFARNGDQPAFANVVRRHLDLVYATALRKVEDAGAAEEVAQNVFAALARKAWQFAPDDSLPAWLYKTTLFEAREWLRGELRRRRREQTAAELGTTMKTPDEQPALRALLPLLDEALLSLREKDRAALLLRFYESQSLRDVGVSLGVGEDAAQKRVGSALEKLAQFFQRRGFKTATVAAATAALQHTAAAAPAAVSASLAQAALKLAPPALGGLAGLLSRLSGLTKAQTAVLCAVLVAAPMAWQWREQQRAAAEAARARTELAAARSEQSTLRSEIERLQVAEAQLSSSIAAAKSLAARNGDAAKRFESWKNRIRALLLAADYHWPDDSPFVRIPKSAARRLIVDLPLSPPGVIKPTARELLGMTPPERGQVEDQLHRHFAELDRLIESQAHATNRSALLNLPASASASRILVVPALGDEIAVLADQLRTGVRNALGDERWAMLEPQLSMVGTHTLRRVLNLDAGTEPQEVAVWIEEHGPATATTGLKWASRGSMFSTSGQALELFLPGNDSPAAVNALERFRENDLPETVNRELLGWLQQQATAHAGKESKP